jgi:hypothetical protein
MPENDLSDQADIARKCPPAVIVIACLFAVAGGVGVAYHATEFNFHGPFQGELVLVCLIRLLAVVAAVFMLRGHNWARWLLMVWLAYHIVLSAFHTAAQVIVHSLLLGVIGFFLFRPEASAYFRAAKRRAVGQGDKNFPRSE